MNDRIRFVMNRIRERLWVRPLATGMVSAFGAFLAKLADDSRLGLWVPDVARESLEKLLDVTAASMLVIATFAVASMVAAYASVSSNATPRAFSLVVGDDVSQTALSRFIGAFIFSLVARVALDNGYYDTAGRFALFVLTACVLAAVVFTFVRWVDRIARMGRMGHTVALVEKAAAAALAQRRKAPTFGACEVTAQPAQGQVARIDTVGYVQRVDVASLQKLAEAWDATIVVDALPGTFMTPQRALARVIDGSATSAQGKGPPEGDRLKAVAGAFTIGERRFFDEDPRFGLVVLSEIASRALSPAVNDPGTAIVVIGTLVRLLLPCSARVEDNPRAVTCGRIQVPRIEARDLFDDAFTAIARDAAGLVEVQVRLQKALGALALDGDADMRDAALRHSCLALARAEAALTLEDDRIRVRAATGRAPP